MKHETRKHLPRELPTDEDRVVVSGLRKLKIEPDVELHRSRSGRNIRLKQSSAAAVASPHGLTPRAPERKAPGEDARRLAKSQVATRDEEDEEQFREKTPRSLTSSVETASPQSNQVGSTTKPRRLSGKREDRRSSFMIHEQVWEQLGFARSSTPEPHTDDAETNQDEANREDPLEEKARQPLRQIEEEDRPEHPTPEAKREVYQFDLWKKAGRNRRLDDAISGYDSAPSPPRPSPPKPSSVKRRSSSADHMSDETHRPFAESARVVSGRQCFGRQHHSIEIVREPTDDSQVSHNLSLTRSTSPVIGGGSRRGGLGIPLPVLSDSDDRAIVRWKRGELLGEGTFGKVHKGLNAETGEFFALKEIEVRAAATDDQMRQLQKLSEEIDVMHNLRHEHIVRYKGSHRSDKHFYIFMEFVPGGSIASNLKQFGAFDEDLVRNYTRQIVDGVVYLHHKGILHRDIKGANVLVTEQGVAKLADFGCSKRLPQIITTSLEESLRSIRGSIPWMAPEVVQQTGHSLKADIWSIGATVIEMATGKHPWPEMTNGLAGMYMIATAKSSPPIPDHLSGEAKSFLSRCFCIDPEERASATELSRHNFLSQR